uniref:Uncharacterized protein n=1 Tax=Anopheles farauti TaxID=69004 RepID=A0A182Q0Q4_9DIPT
MGSKPWSERWRFRRMVYPSGLLSLSGSCRSDVSVDVPRCRCSARPARRIGGGGVGSCLLMKVLHREVLQLHRMMVSTGVVMRMMKMIVGGRLVRRIWFMLGGATTTTIR